MKENFTGVLFLIKKINMDSEKIIEILNEEAKKFSSPLTPDGLQLLVINVVQLAVKDQTIKADKWDSLKGELTPFFFEKDGEAKTVFLSEAKSIAETTAQAFNLL